MMPCFNSDTKGMNVGQLEDQIPKFSFITQEKKEIPSIYQKLTFALHTQQNNLYSLLTGRHINIFTSINFIFKNI